MSSVKKLYWYNLLTAASLTVVAEFLFVDQLLLRIQTPVAVIGVLKALIFFLPVVSYQLAVPLLNRTSLEVPLCASFYVLRVLLPALVPAAALLGTGNSVLQWMSMVILPVAMMLATFANNALMVIYRRQLPENEFNRDVGVIQMCFYLPCFVLGIPVSLIFKRAAVSDDRSFFVIYLTAMLVCALFQLPAFAVMCSLGWKRRRCEAPSAGDSGTDWLSPYRDVRYRKTLTVTFLHALVSGVGIAYIGVFCLKLLMVPVSGAFIVRTAASIIGMALMPYAGRLADRIGYRRMYAGGGALLSLGLALTVLFPHPWVLPLCALLFWDGVNSPAGVALQMCEQAAASKLSPARDTAGYIAAFNVARCTGIGAGALIAGVLFRTVIGFGLSEAAGLRIVFAACLLPLALLTIVGGKREEELPLHTEKPR